MARADTVSLKVLENADGGGNSHRSVGALVVGRREGSRDVTSAARHVGGAGGQVFEEQAEYTQTRLYAE